MAKYYKKIIILNSFLLIGILFLFNCVSPKYVGSNLNQLKNGKKEGVWIYIDSSENILKSCRYKNNLLDGICIDYNRFKIVIRKANYKKGYLDGSVILYNDNGKITGKAKYKKGIVVFSKSYNFY